MAMVSSLPLSAGAIFFITGLFLTVGVLYRLFRICAGRTGNEGVNTYRLLTIPVTDVILLLTFAVFVVLTVFGVRVSDELTTWEYLKEGDVRRFNTNWDMVQSTSIALQFVTKLPLHVRLLECKSYFPSVARPVLYVVLGLHTLLFIVALVLGSLHTTAAGAAANLVFTLTTDISLLLLCTMLLLHPTVRSLGTRRQSIVAWLLLPVGVTSLSAGLVRFIIGRHHRPSVLSGRTLLWLAIETVASVVAGHFPTFRRLFDPVKGSAAAKREGFYGIDDDDENEPEKGTELVESPRSPPQSAKAGHYFRRYQEDVDA